MILPDFFKRSAYPMGKIEKRLDCASQADFCICLYNPSSFKRHDYLQKACDIMLKINVLMFRQALYATLGVMVKL